MTARILTSSPLYHSLCLAPHFSHSFRKPIHMSLPCKGGGGGGCVAQERHHQCTIIRANIMHFDSSLNHAPGHTDAKVRISVTLMEKFWKSRTATCLTCHDAELAVSTRNGPAKCVAVQNQTRYYIDCWPHSRRTSTFQLGKQMAHLQLFIDQRFSGTRKFCMPGTHDFGFVTTLSLPLGHAVPLLGGGQHGWSAAQLCHA